jgi:DNA-binding transcriptional ArsR family regulator
MTDSISSTCAALADPTRRAILARLALGEASVTDLAEPFKMSMPAVSKHLRVLERAGLISRGRDAQRRPCKLLADPLEETAQWLNEYKPFWNQSPESSGAPLGGMQAEENRGKKHRSKKKDKKKKHGRHKEKK